MAQIKVLALDLEGTLISNAVSQIPRPGLYDFLLTFCLNAFPRVVIYSAVPRGRVYSILGHLASRVDVPEAAMSLEQVEWTGPHKDLRFVEGADVSEILIVDDQEDYIHPDQREQWIRIREFAPPYPEDDRALMEVREIIENRL